MLRLVLLLLLLMSTGAMVRADILHGFAPEVASRAGSYAIRKVETAANEALLRFELRPGDCASVRDCMSARERAELRSRVQDPLEREIWYAFSLRLPSDYAELSPKQILGQWFDGGHPVLYNRYEEGRFSFFMITTEPRATARCDLPEFKKGRWNRFVYRVRWSERDSGRVTIWHDGEPVFDLAGRTLSPDWRHGPKFKLGIYRSDLKRLRGEPAPVQRAEFARLMRIESPLEHAARGFPASDGSGVLTSAHGDEAAHRKLDADMSAATRHAQDDHDVDTTPYARPNPSSDQPETARRSMPQGMARNDLMSLPQGAADDRGNAMAPALASAMSPGSGVGGWAPAKAALDGPLADRAEQQVWCRSQQREVRPDWDRAGSGPALDGDARALHEPTSLLSTRPVHFTAAHGGSDAPTATP